MKLEYKKRKRSSLALKSKDGEGRGMVGWGGERISRTNAIFGFIKGFASHDA